VLSIKVFITELISFLLFREKEKKRQIRSLQEKFSYFHVKGSYSDAVSFFFKKKDSISEQLKSWFGY
jgi:hypothetical protein